MAGFMKTLAGANNEWGKISCAEGVGGIGPENMVDNRGKKLMVTIGTQTTVFGAEDVVGITLVAATSEWVKYVIKTKNGKEYFATFPVFTTGKNGKTFSNGLLQFEWWMAEHLYKETPVAPAAPVAPVPPVAPMEPVTPVAPVEPAAPAAPVAPVAPKPKKPILPAPMPALPVETEVPAAKMPKYPVSSRPKKPSVADENAAVSGEEEAADDGGLL